MMRIVQIGPFPVSDHLISGGVESSVHGLVWEQAKTQTVFVMDIPRIEYDDSVEALGSLTVFRFRNYGRYNKDAIGRIPEIVEQILKLNPSVCHIHGTNGFSYLLFESLKEKMIPTIVTVHGLLLAEKKKALRHHFSLKTLYQYIVQTKAERRLLYLASDVIVDTEYVANSIKRYRRDKGINTSIIPQGIDNRFFHFSCSVHSSTVLSVGAFSRRKGHLLLVKAFEKVCENNDTVRLVICGSMADEVYFQQLNEYVSKSLCRDRISLLVNVSQECLFQQFTEARVFALHSQEESQGIVFAEAMAVGLPVVATRVGGIPNVVIDNQCGLLSDFGDIDSFATSLEKVLSSDTFWGRLSSSCRKEAKRYSWDRIADAVQNRYDSMISEY